MKKTLLVFMCMIATMTYAQELQVQVGENLNKFVVEHTEANDQHMLYGYAELSVGEINSTYVQAIYEYSFAVVSLHAEYRSILSEGGKWMNTYIAGITFSLLSNESYHISLSPLYRYDERSMWQATSVYGANYKCLTFDGYFDLFGDKDIYAFSENKIKYNFGKIFVGANFEYSLNISESKLTPYIMLGFKF